MQKGVYNAILQKVQKSSQYQKKANIFIHISTWREFRTNEEFKKFEPVKKHATKPYCD